MRDYVAVVIEEKRPIDCIRRMRNFAANES